MGRKIQVSFLPRIGTFQRAAANLQAISRLPRTGDRRGHGKERRSWAYILRMPLVRKIERRESGHLLCSSSVALIAFAVGDDKFGSIREVPEGFSVMAVPGLDPGSDPATHAVRRVERRQVSCHSPKTFAFAGSCCGPRQCGTSLCGASAWMAGSIPGSSPGTAMTTEGPDAIGNGRTNN
jgi:hypothetical protein